MMRVPQWGPSNWVDSFLRVNMREKTNNRIMKASADKWVSSEGDSFAAKKNDLHLLSPHSQTDITITSLS